MANFSRVFRQLSRSDPGLYHQRAEMLGAAAAAHDAELVMFHYSRLLESCTRCHAAYAGARFPGFTSPDPEHHTH